MARESDESNASGGPPATLQSLLDNRQYLSTGCNTCRDFGPDLHPAELIARYGGNATVPAIARQRVCKRCRTHAQRRGPRARAEPTILARLHPARRAVADGGGRDRGAVTTV